MTDVLLVFARYPEPGRCKTRMIPQLGVERATQLHADMTHHTLTWARALRDLSGVKIEVHFDGGTAASMAERFGDDFDYVPQQGKNLGEKLAYAFHRHSARQAQRIVVVGTDCPQLSEHVAQAAFARLADHECCIAGAEDGGYVLLGIGSQSQHSCPGHAHSIRSQVIDGIFRDVTWGTATVLEETIGRICDVNASCALLPTLSDVDTPEDLAVWDQAINQPGLLAPEICVIIPTLNEEHHLASAIASSRSGRRTETIVVAAGDFRESLKVAAAQQVQFLSAPRGRAKQMNLGAKLARADKLLFLHSDTYLPANFADAVIECLGEPGVVAGAFRLKISSQSWQSKMVELGVLCRTIFRKMPYGDQAIFMTRDQFQQMGGYRDLPIMEDYELMKRLRRTGPIAISRDAVVTSSRRWERVGFLRTTLVNQLMIVGYHCGISLETLARLYRRG